MTEPWKRNDELPRNQIVEVMVILHHHTANAYKVSNTGREKDAVWVPKSQSEWTPKGTSGAGELQLPMWMAQDKELI